MLAKWCLMLLFSCCLAGCSDSTNSDPKPVSGKVDPRLEISGKGTPSGKNTADPLK